MGAFFAATIFLGSFLLFQVQLIIAKIILPWFGGVASVWTTCMLFFQVTLLLGYLYAHGLGAGVLAAYGRPGDVYRFYEINPLVVKVAETEFSYLKDTAAGVEVVLGDARLSMEREPAQGYDVFVVDAFSGDSIPAHLLTREALDLYLRHMERDGVLAFHITNWCIDLKPVLGRLAMETGMRALSVVTEGNKETGAAYTRWVLLSAAPENFRKSPLPGAGTPLPASRDMPLWTDDFSSLIPLPGS